MRELEQIIKEEGYDKFPRVTIEDIEAAIASEYYFTAADGYVGVIISDQEEMDKIEKDVSGIHKLVPPEPLETLTFCVLILKNGYTVTGEGACASPENFNAKAGRASARRNAINKMWPLLGYTLRQELHEADHD